MPYVFIFSFIVKPVPVQAAKGPRPTSKVTLIVAIVVSVALFLMLLLIAAILYRRRQLYGGFYICTTPPLPDMIPRLDSSIALIEQVNKLPYDKRWEFPREQLHFGKFWIFIGTAGIDSPILEQRTIKRRLCVGWFGLFPARCDRLNLLVAMQ